MQPELGSSLKVGKERIIATIIGGIVGMAMLAFERYAVPIVQGGQQSRKESSYYGGMCPPDATHLYELHVFALDTKLQLENGFYLNELYKQMDGHILEQCTIKGTYDN